MVTKRREDSNLSFGREMKEGIAAIRGKSGIVAVMVPVREEEVRC